MAHFIPQGFQFGAVYSGVKRDASRNDLTLITSDTPCVAAGVYTQNRVCAAPVIYDKCHTPSDAIRAVVINSGVANACTGQQGYDDAVEMARLASQAVKADTDDAALVMSTGVIGHFLPMSKIKRGIASVSKKLGRDEASLEKAASGIMTTDTVMKLFSRQIVINGTTINIAGMAKGAGMIAPNMATFLGVVMTDAKLSKDSITPLLRKIAGRTFNCVTVDGHTSTNDTLLLLANGAAGGEDVSRNKAFAEALEGVCGDLARSIPADGEGASHLVTIQVSGLKTEANARKIARLIAESPLVKCAFAGNDPNWGRIVSAAGYAGIPFDPVGVSLYLNGTKLFENGAPVKFNAAKVSQSMAANKEISVDLRFSEGEKEATFWTCDLTTEYVHINADYHT